MLRDGRLEPDGAEIRCDVCIVGAGPAGLVLAAELAGSALRIVILDSGGPGEDPEADALSELEFESAHFRSPGPTRRRQLGGMAARWDTALPRGLGARLVRLDAIDFEEREWVPHSGWPFGLSDLEPDYQRAEALFGLRPRPGGVAAPTGALPLDEDLIVTTPERLIPRERMTRTLRDRVASAHRTTMLHHATAVAIESDAPEGTVTVRGGPSHGFRVRAGAIVLAAGTIESARLLLASRERLGAEPRSFDNVGRYYMDHPYLIAGFWWPRNPALFDRLALYDIRERAGELHSARLRLAEPAQRAQHLLSSQVRLQPRLAARQRETLEVGRSLGASLRRGKLPPRPLEAGRRALRGLPELLWTGARLGLRQRRLRPQPTRVGWSALGGNAGRFRHLTLVLQPEQAPNPEHHVTLSEHRDRFGLPLPRLRWSWSEQDLDSIRRTRDLLAAEIERAGLGTVTEGGEELAAELAAAGIERQDSGNGELPPLLMPEGAHHHLGTTRMHRDPSRGVVDEHSRVHGTAGLYVAGGSVFPTSGSANPTLTIAALSIRLADHLRGWLDG